LRELHQRYADSDVQLISVHTPEFKHEHDIENVRAKVTENNLTYPVAIDNDWTIWNAFHNRYWPSLYLIDRQGIVREHHAGEIHVDTPTWEKLLIQIEELRNESS
jgi:hypothetical protein